MLKDNRIKETLFKILSPFRKLLMLDNKRENLTLLVCLLS